MSSAGGGGTLESPTTMLFSETAESTATRELRLDGCLACGMTPERMYTMHCHTDSIHPNERVKVQLQRAARAAPRMPYSIELGWLDLGSVEATSHLMTLSRCLGNLSCELGALTFTNSGLDDTHLFHLITALPQSAPLTLLDLSSQHLSGLALTQRLLRPPPTNPHHPNNRVLKPRHRLRVTTSYPLRPREKAWHRA